MCLSRPIIGLYLFSFQLSFLGYPSGYSTAASTNCNFYVRKVENILIYVFELDGNLKNYIEKIEPVN